MVVAVSWYRKELVAASAEVAPAEAARLRTTQREGEQQMQEWMEGDRLWLARRGGGARWRTMVEEKGGSSVWRRERERERERRDAARLASAGARFIFASRGRHDRKWRG
jgi:hypothetical protein